MCKRLSRSFIHSVDPYTSLNAEGELHQESIQKVSFNYEGFVNPYLQPFPLLLGGILWHPGHEEPAG